MKNNSTTALPNQINKVFFDFQLSSSLEHFIRCSCDTTDKPRLTIEVFLLRFSKAGQPREPPSTCPPLTEPGNNWSKRARLRNAGSPSLQHHRTPTSMAGDGPASLLTGMPPQQAWWKGCTGTIPPTAPTLMIPRHPPGGWKGRQPEIPSPSPQTRGPETWGQPAARPALPHCAIPVATGRGDPREPTHELGAAAAPSSGGNRTDTSTHHLFSSSHCCPSPQGTQTCSTHVLPSPLERASPQTAAAGLEPTKGEPSRMETRPARAPHSLLANYHSGITLKGHLRKRIDLCENVNRDAGTSITGRRAPA